MAVYAYTRVSRTDLHAANQTQQIAGRFNVSKFFEDNGASGSTLAKDRPGLTEALQTLQPGDTLVVAAIDRLGRNTQDVLATVQKVLARDAHLISLREGVDFNTHVGKLVATVLAAVAEMELQTLKDRTRHGIERARQQGRAIGRPITHDYSLIANHVRQGHTIAGTALFFNIDKGTVRRALERTQVQA